MPFIATLSNACNANDDVHKRINLPSLMKYVCLIIGNDFTVFISELIRRKSEFLYFLKKRVFPLLAVCLK